MEHAAIQILLLLLVGCLVALGARRIKVPYTLALVLTGVALSFVRIEELEVFHLTSEVLFTFLLPALLFEAAFHLDIADFRKNAASILTLALVGVVISAGLTGLLVYGALVATGLAPGLSIAVIGLFAVVIAATDPISVLALFRTLGVQKRLYLLVEGESLLNDGVAVVLFLIVAAVFGVHVGHADHVELGRPNAGKSTLINRILGEERLLTGPEAGITRDSISLRLDWDGVPVRLFDTAGMRKRAKVQDKLEKLSVSDGLRAVKFAEVVVVLLDAAIPFEQQDLRIADLAEREGRAVVVAVNKWDLEEDKQGKLRDLKEAFERLLPQLKGAPLVTVSARTGRGLDRLQAAILKAHEIWNTRISTAKLNRWLTGMLEQHPPPAPGGKRIKLRYMTQAKTRPPAFVVMCSHPEALPDSYSRYLVNGLRGDFDMPGTPIRLYMRSQADKNPYKGRKKSTPSRLRKHLGKGERG